MQPALELAGYLFIGTLLFGVGLVAYIFWGVLHRPKPLRPLPPVREIPSLALQEIERVRNELNRQAQRATGTQRERMEWEARRLENRHGKLEADTRQDRLAYFDAVEQQEKAWFRWKDLHDRSLGAGLKPKPDEDRRLAGLEREFQMTVHRVEEEREAAVARDRLNLEELRGQDVLRTIMEAPPPGDGNSPLPPETPGPEIPLQEALSSETPFEDETPPLHQADFADEQQNKAGKTYRDATFSLEFTPDGVMRGVKLDGGSFQGVRFEGIHLYQECSFSGANLARITLARGERPHQFVGCDFSGASFAGSRLEYLLFSQCDLSHSQWRGAVLDRVKFVDCQSGGAAWEDADLGNTSMPSAMLEEGDFSEAAVPPPHLSSEGVQSPRENDASPSLEMTGTLAEGLGEEEGEDAKESTEKPDSALENS